VANLVTSIGMMSFLPFFPQHLAKLGVAAEDVPLWTGLIFGAAPLVASLMTPIWSALGDRFGRRLMTVRAMLAITVFVGSMAFATEAWQLFVLRLGQGCFSGFIAPSITLVSVVAPAGRQGFVTGSLQTAMALGTMVGPLLGGAVISAEGGEALAGLEAVFVGVAIASAFSAGLVWFLALEDASDRQQVEAGARPLAVLRASLRDLVAVWERPALRDALQLLFWMVLGIGASNPLLLIFVEELGASPERASFLTALLFSVGAGVNLVAMPLWGRLGDRVGHAVALRRCALLVLVTLAMHALTTNVTMLFVVRVLLFGAMAGSSPSTYGLAADEIPVHRRGSAMGAVFSARTLAFSVSAMVGGLVSQWIGIRGLFVAGSLVLLAAILHTGMRRRRAAVEEA